jgi:hypothetical protein
LRMPVATFTWFKERRANARSGVVAQFQNLLRFSHLAK